MEPSLFIPAPGKIADDEWRGFITEHRGLLEEIEKKTGKTRYTPSKEKVLRFLQVPLQNIQIVILGQDPYPQPGVATGRAFEVRTLTSWRQKFSNVSLKNIVRAIYQAYTGETLKYIQVLSKMEESSSLFQDEKVFQLLPPDQLFINWEKQGVLLLNTAFTCEVNKPGGHGKIWQPFTRALLEFLATKPGLTWFLWGNHALEITKGIELKHYYTSSHPMMCYQGDKRDNDFLFGKQNHFAETKNLVDWTGVKTS